MLRKKFDILNQISDTENVKVIRNNGTTMEIPKDELVGDRYSAGMIPADIELLMFNCWKKGQKNK